MSRDSFENQRVDKWKELSLLVSSNPPRQCPPLFPELGCFHAALGELMTCCCFFQAPRVEAQTILGSLVCFPNIYHQIPVLQNVPGSHEIIVSNEEFKVHLIWKPHVVTYTHILMPLVPFPFMVRIKYCRIYFAFFIFIEFLCFLCTNLLRPSCFRQSARQIYSWKAALKADGVSQTKHSKVHLLHKAL